MSFWILSVLTIEFVILILIGLRVGVLLDRGTTLINQTKINKEPNDKECNKQHLVTISF